MTTTPETRPFRFGVVAAQAPTGAAWTDLAHRVENAGYDTLVMPDNVSFGSWSPAAVRGCCGSPAGMPTSPPSGSPSTPRLMEAFAPVVGLLAGS